MNRTQRICCRTVRHLINTHLLDKITDATAAYRTYVTPAQDIEVAISDL